MISFAPQLYTTYLIESHGSFSVLTISIQIPGLGILIYFYFVSKAGAWVILTHSVALMMMTTLLLQFWYYAYKKGHRGLNWLHYLLVADEEEFTPNIINSDFERSSREELLFGR